MGGFLHCHTANLNFKLDLPSMDMDSGFMQRCLQLARQGSGYVAPNPMVGAVLVHGGRIIGEGFHEVYGGPHAEVNCLASVKPADRPLIPDAVLYVSLEPCAHHGKTPPCADLIIENRIREVVIGCRDPFPEVDGKGIEKLLTAGIRVRDGIEEGACREINKRFFTFHEKKRPYIILKWAQSSNRKMAAMGEERLMITNDFSNRLVHKWRSEESAILVGTNTALTDDPALTTRLWSGRHPVRAVIDMDLRLPQDLKLFNRKHPTIVFNTVNHLEEENIFYYMVTREENLIPQVVQALYQLKLQSVIVEGGALLLQSFIDAGLWDEIRTITNNDLLVTEGLRAPELPQVICIEEFPLLTDSISIYLPA
jgi:diaminohydroxyphosphoribosylaminopyrimidine deaminase / 5-amino-6-(5-phosphoribosylamino)uracil reductase